MTKCRLASFAAYIAVVSADPVRFDGALNDFCGRFTQMKLGKMTPPDWSWCGVNNVCTNIFWTTQWKQEIVVAFPGASSPWATQPVLCEEALVDVAFSELGPAKTQPKKPFRPHRAVATSVPLHYHGARVELADDRPRIRVQFVVQHRSVEHSMLFDTGADSVHVERGVATKKTQPASLQAPVRAGLRTRYPDRGAAVGVGGPREIGYGATGATDAIYEIKRVRELASIAGTRGGFSFNVNLGLTDLVDDLAMGSALFGAARTSEFARAAGVFAWVPPITRGEQKTGSAGKLLIRAQDWSRHCAEQLSPIFVNVNQAVSPIHWAVDGSIRIDGHEMRVNWIVDTGAAGLILHPYMFDVLTKRLEAAGSLVHDPAAGALMVVLGCKEFRTRFPTIRVEVSDRAGYFALDITPEMYVARVSKDEESCLLNVLHHGAAVQGRPEVLLGVGFLERVVSIFDARNNKVGFCKRKKDLH